MALNLASRTMLHTYNRVNGMVNTAWISGYLRGITPNRKIIYIQQTNNENQFLPVLLPDGYKLPDTFKEFSPISAVCHILGRPMGSGQQMAMAKALGVYEPNVLEMQLPSAVRNAAYGSGMEDEVEAFLRGAKGDEGSAEGKVSVMPPDSSFLHKVPEGAPESKFKPFTGRDDKLFDASNIVRVAGFVHDLMLERADEEKGVNGKLELLIRQQNEPNYAIPIWYYGKLSEAVADRLEVGLPILIVGKLRIHVRKTGMKDEATGLEIVDKRPYIHCEGPPMVPKIHPKDGAITHLPDWAWELRQQATSVKRRVQTVKKAANEVAESESSVPLVNNVGELDGTIEASQAPRKPSGDGIGVNVSVIDDF